MSADPIPAGYVTLPETVKRLAADLSNQEVTVNPDSRAVRAWAKRETAVWKLHEALGKGRLAGFVRSASGDMFRITADDWHGPVIVRNTFIGGVIHASVEAAISRHSGRRVLIETAAFDKWMKARPRKSIASNDDCLAWLEAEMRANPTASPHPKAHYLDEAKTRSGVSERQFNRLWDQAKQETGTNWKSGRRPKSPQ
jgi:hypothetical protein